MDIIDAPTVYLVGTSFFDLDEVSQWLAEAGMEWNTDTNHDAEALTEFAGRICYQSFGENQGRKNNADYLTNILVSGHGSVTEHATWNFLITGVSRSLTHELIRHRAGIAISQLSQRYVDEADGAFVIPPAIQGNMTLVQHWKNAMWRSQHDYIELADELAQQIATAHPDLTKREKRKMAREAARSVLPNATETKILLTANTRALRHILELRGSAGADPEIRRLAVALLRTVQPEAPNLFGDMQIVTLPDGSAGITAQYHKV